MDEIGTFKSVKKDHLGKPSFDSLLDYDDTNNTKFLKKAKPRDLFL